MQNKILIVEDFEPTILLLQEFLEDLDNAEIYIARNGMDCLQRAVEILPNLILLDISMPEMDGFEVCRRLKANVKTVNIPVIFLSALSESLEKVRAFELGGVDYLTKPFNQLELLARINTHLKLYNLNKSLTHKNDEYVVLNENFRVQNQQLIKAKEKAEESEIRFRSIIENTRAGYFFISNDGIFQNVNKAWLDLHKYKTYDEIIGKHFSIVEKSNDIDGAMQIIEAVTRGNTAFLNDDFRRKCKDGTIGYNSFSARPVYVNHAIVGIEGFIIDMTAHIETEKKVLKAIIEAEERERTCFARELHDGLGPLLSNIKLCFEWINRPSLKTPKETILKKLNYSIDAAVLTVKEISYKLSPHILANFGLAFSIQSFIDKILDTHGISIFFESNTQQRFSKEIEITIYRVLLECINNTLKHANAENISIKLKQENNTIKVNYSEDGIGFDYNEIIAKNKGLGLYNIQNRIATLGGDFTIESKKEQGVIINFTLHL